MADYRELLRRAIEALPENTGVNRRAVYEKARSALVGQLRSIEPPLPAREITTHRLALEDCIRQVEQEATDRLLGGLREAETVSDTPEAAPDAVPQPVEPLVEIPEPVEPEVSSEPVSQDPDSTDFTPFDENADAADETVADAEADVLPTEEPVSHDEEIAAGDDPSIADELVATESAFDEDRFEDPVIADEPPAAREPAPGSIEEIIALAQRSGAEEQPVPQPAESDSFETAPDDTVPVEDAFGDAPAPDAPSEPVFDLPLRGPAMPTRFDSDAALAPLEPDNEPEALAPLIDLHGQPLRSERDTDPNAPENVIAQAMSSVREVDIDSMTRNTAEISDAQVAIDRAIAALDREARGEGAEPVDDDGAAAAVRTDGEDSSNDAGAERERGGGFSAVTVFLFVAVLLLGGAGVAGYWAWREGYIDLNTVFAQGQPAEQVASVEEPVEPDPEATEPPIETVDPGNTTPDVPPVNGGVSGQTMPGEELPFTDTETPAPATSEPEASFEDRLPSEAQPLVNGTDDPSDEQAIEIAAAGPQSLLLEEQPNGATGAVPYSGSVQWSRGSDELGHPTIIAQASIPARNLEMRMVLRRNGDGNLPASHLMEINFTVAETFVGGSIASLPGVMLKDEELVQGQPLTGASARIVGNSFLFALSSASARDVETNEALLADRAWLDLAMVYGTGRRAILTLEKGEDGETIFSDVLAAWAALDTPAATDG